MASKDTGSEEGNFPEVPEQVEEESNPEASTRATSLASEDESLTTLLARQAQGLRKMATAPTEDEVAILSDLFQNVALEEDRKAIIEAMKSFSADPALTTEVKKVVDQYEAATAAGDNTKTIFGKDAKMSNKFVSNLPKFGLNKDFTWQELVANLEMVRSTGIYPDFEMKLMLWGCLEGPASEYMRAHTELMDGSFANALAALSKVFGKSISQNVQDLTQIHQLQGEKVEIFEARLINASGRLKPTKPTLIKRQIDATGKSSIVPNATYNEEFNMYKGQCQLMEKLMLQQFLNGLRADIKRQMKIDASVYTNLTEAVSAAKAVEEFIEQQLGIGVGAYAIEAEETEEVNAIYGYGYGRGRGRGRGRGQFLKDMEQQSTLGEIRKNKKKKQAECFRCGEKGHFAKDCTNTVIKYVKQKSPSPAPGATGYSGYPKKSNLKTFGNQGNQPRGQIKRKTIFRRAKSPGKSGQKKGGFQKKVYVNQTDAEPEEEEGEDEEDYDEEVYEEYVDYEDSKN